MQSACGSRGGRGASQGQRGPGARTSFWGWARRGNVVPCCAPAAGAGGEAAPATDAGHFREHESAVSGIWCHVSHMPRPTEGNLRATWLQREICIQYPPTTSSNNQLLGPRPGRGGAQEAGSRACARVERGRRGRAGLQSSTCIEAWRPGGWRSSAAGVAPRGQGGTGEEPGYRRWLPGRPGGGPTWSRFLSSPSAQHAALCTSLRPLASSGSSTGPSAPGKGITS